MHPRDCKKQRQNIRIFIYLIQSKSGREEGRAGTKERVSKIRRMKKGEGGREGGGREGGTREGARVGTKAKE